MPGRACLEWRCRRGTKELDLLLQAWLALGYEHSGESERRAFLALLDWPDDALGRLLLGQDRAADPELDALADRIRAVSLHRP